MQTTTIERVATVFNGTYTINSPKGEHRTFKVHTVRKGKLEGKRIVSLMTGTDNENDFTGFGFVTDRGINVWSKKRNGNYPIYAKMLWGMLTDTCPTLVEAGYELLAKGSCIKCNRPLTHPTSIKTGIGPECGAEIHAAYNAVHDTDICYNTLTTEFDDCYNDDSGE